MRLAILALALAACAPAEWEPAGRRLSWSHSILRVSIDPALDGAVVEQAMADLNHRAGCTIFVVGSPADVTVSLGSASSACTEDAAACAFGVDVGTTQQAASVVLYGAGSSVDTYLLVYHELGHVLGLAHDLRDVSIMMPNITDHDEDPLPLPTLSDRDASGLHDVYCR